MEVWIGRDGERHGPYKEVEVRQWLRSGQVSPQDLGWREGMADWAPLSSLFPEEIPAAPPAFSPPPAPPQAHVWGAAAVANNAAALTDYAGFWKRAAAYILDALVLWIPNLILGSLLGATEARNVYIEGAAAAGSDPQVALQALEVYFNAMIPTMIAQTVLVWLYFALCESSPWQGTLGKRALGIRVTGLQGERISFLRATGRYFAKIPSAMIFCIGFLMVAWTQRRQGLHDLIAQTLVLNGRTGNATVTRPGANRDQGSFNA
ncbi:MAG TPA: RDD family protein [Dyella sp.]|uniref:RDD family protein n=1 Tax=Dyella sp. TaxID=1869338 RepID=UPI002D77A67D|nr:RDD family protein [Dyella sp.]HET6553779.1 RDD family protein [Dyella sp.]